MSDDVQIVSLGKGLSILIHTIHKNMVSTRLEHIRSKKDSTAMPTEMICSCSGTHVVEHKYN